MPLAVNSFGAICFLACRGFTRDGGGCAVIPDELSDFLAIICLVGSNRVSRSRRLQDRVHDLTVVHMATCHDKIQWSAFAVDDGMDFRAPAAAAAADRLFFLPPFAPLAARWAFTIVLSIMRRLSRDFAANVSNIFFQTPLRDQRLKRLSTVVYGPYRSGKSRQGIPVRNT